MIHTLFNQSGNEAAQRPAQSALHSALPEMTLNKDSAYFMPAVAAYHSDCIWEVEWRAKFFSHCNYRVWTIVFHKAISETYIIAKDHNSINRTQSLAGRVLHSLGCDMIGS